MNPLAELVSSTHPAVTAFVGVAVPQAGWDNRPAWDNWGKNPGSPWDNRPSWDNWKKR